MNGRRDFRPDERRGRGIASPLDIVEGFLNEELDAASDPLTGATMASGTLIAWGQDAPSSGQDLGDWDAAANDPALSDGSGTDGDFYRVSEAGSTTLDGITAWAQAQYLKTVDGVWVRHASEFFEVDSITDLGDWNAATNDPALASGVGDEEDFYRVSEDGTTSLDGIADWSAGEFLQFRDGAWIRRSTRSVVYLVNRDTGLSGSKGDYFIAAKLNGEFRIIWLSCSTVRP